MPADQRVAMFKDLAVARHIRTPVEMVFRVPAVIAVMGRCRVEGLPCGPRIRQVQNHRDAPRLEKIINRPEPVVVAMDVPAVRIAQHHADGLPHLNGHGPAIVEVPTEFGDDPLRIARFVTPHGAKRRAEPETAGVRPGFAQQVLFIRRHGFRRLVVGVRHIEGRPHGDCIHHANATLFPALNVQMNVDLRIARTPCIRAGSVW